MIFYIQNQFTLWSQAQVILLILFLDPFLLVTFDKYTTHVLFGISIQSYTLPSFLCIFSYVIAQVHLVYGLLFVQIFYLLRLLQSQAIVNIVASKLELELILILLIFIRIDIKATLVDLTIALIIAKLFAIQKYTFIFESALISKRQYILLTINVLKVIQSELLTGIHSYDHLYDQFGSEISNQSLNSRIQSLSRQAKVHYL